MKHLLLLAAIPVLGLYFYRFKRAIELVDESERRRFIQQAGMPWWGGIAYCAGFVALYFAPSFTLRLLVATLLVSAVAIGTAWQHHRLRTLGFDTEFRDSLLRSSFLAAAGVVLILSWLILVW